MTDGSSGASGSKAGGVRTALITGGGRGIGRAIAIRFGREGMVIGLAGRGHASLEAVSREISEAGGCAVWKVADVSDPESVQQLTDWAIAELGGIDVLVNNAGIDHEAGFLDIGDDDWDRVISTNLTGPFLVSKRVARHMVHHGGGSIIHIGSIDTQGADGPYASYVTAKTGLLGLTRAMATELAPHGIRVNCVSPGYTDTDLIESAVGGSQNYQRLRESFERVPMRRLVGPMEVAAACWFLATDESSAVTGTELTVDGGLTANLYIQETIRQR
jgi:NAD(P)-dependent dehydrogenase (short-subunit alcohol dehydrogenase family)